jgi:hypothetical protein
LKLLKESCSLETVRLSALILRRELFRGRKFNLLKGNYGLKTVKVSALIFEIEVIVY